MAPPINHSNRLRKAGDQVKAAQARREAAQVHLRTTFREAIDSGEVNVTTAAQLAGISRITAHKLLKQRNDVTATVS